ncbi:hypothetical protein KFK09_001073 [Dendrobium nobile]|uniref:Uncharacterized protein n=1 Tax=Dendrobium nobile TaxID=94219 RepID=A0A8T3C998_DENNO|nr:hypothetical protein KFK09_001073 [Dendrobium nobile]
MVEVVEASKGSNVEVLVVPPSPLEFPKAQVAMTMGAFTFFTSTGNGICALAGLTLKGLDVEGPQCRRHVRRGSGGFLEDGWRK